METLSIFHAAKGYHLFPTTKMTRRHCTLGFAGFRVENQNVVKLWVWVRNGVTVGVGIGVRVRVRVWVRFRAKVRVWNFLSRMQNNILGYFFKFA